MCPLCKIPSPQGREGDVCSVHSQRVLVTKEVFDAQPNDAFLGLLLDEKYELCRPLGHGGFGSVYYAVQRGQIRREVAIKLLTRQSPEYLDLFKDEMRMVAQLRSPYTVRYLDSGVHHDSQLQRELPYMVMEYLQGETLAHRLINGGSITPDEAVELFDHLLDSLDEAHSFGIVHRDLKPLTLMLTPTRQGGKRMTVLDFGVARVIDQASREATRNRIMGTPYYLAPEVLLQQEVTPQGDLFAVGVILYEALMCRSPFLNEELQGVEPYLKLRALYKAEERYEPLTPQLKAQFEPFFDRALSVSLKTRFQDAAEMRSALKECLKRSAYAPTTLGQDTQFDLPKIDIEPLVEDEPETTRAVTAQEMRVGLQSNDQTVLTDRLPRPAPPRPQPSALASPSPQPSPNPAPLMSPSPQSAPRPPQPALSQPSARPMPELTPFTQTQAPMSIPISAPRSRRSKLNLPLIGVSLSAMVLGALLVYLNLNERFDPCVLSRDTLSIQAEQLETDQIKAPAPSAVVRLRSWTLKRPCSPQEQGCDQGVRTCPLRSLITQTQALNNQEFMACQLAGMCDSDSSAQGAQVRRCVSGEGESSSTLCVPAQLAHQYCAWRGLTIPTINAWYRMIERPDLRTNSPQWAVMPDGELVKLSPQFALNDAQGLGELSSLDSKSFTQEELLSDSGAPIASVRCVRAYQSEP